MVKESHPYALWQRIQFLQMVRKEKNWSGILLSSVKWSMKIKNISKPKTANSRGDVQNEANGQVMNVLISLIKA